MSCTKDRQALKFAGIFRSPLLTLHRQFKQESSELVEHPGKRTLELCDTTTSGGAFAAVTRESQEILTEIGCFLCCSYLLANGFISIEDFSTGLTVVNLCDRLRTEMPESEVI